MLLADLGVSLEPVQPWSAPTVGPAALAGVALALVMLTLWTYLGVTQATWRRVLIVLLLRLACLALVFAMMLRPSFATTQLEGVEGSKLLVVWDRSASMNVADVDGQPTRWDHLQRLWASDAVQRRLRDLAAIQKIEVVKYLAAEDLRPDESDAKPTGRRTDIGAWLHELWQKHGHEKRVRGILLFSDGADNGTRFSAQDKARQWRGIAPIHTFGAGDPKNAKFKKDIGLTSLIVKTAPVSVKAKIEVDAVAQAPGFDKTRVEIKSWFERVADKKQTPLKDIKEFEIRQEKDQRITLQGDAPEEPGEYKLTVRITPHPDEANVQNNEISTYVTVIKSKINVLWVDRFRVWEPTFAIRLALAPEERFAVHQVILPSKKPVDPHKLYEFNLRHYDVIVIGDVTAKDFCQGDPKLFDTIKKMVEEKSTGLLMLGGTQTMCNGGWRDYPAFMYLLPVRFDLDGDKANFIEEDVRPLPTTAGLEHPFLKLETDLDKKKLWQKDFDPLDGIAPLGAKKADAIELLTWKNEIVMATTTVSQRGRVVVFAGDSTYPSWFGDVQRPHLVAPYTKFWKNLIFWLAKEEDNANQLWIKLDRRRIGTEAGDALNFTFGLKGKTELKDAKFTAKVMRDMQEFPVTFARKRDQQEGTFRGAKEPGEYQLVITGKAKDDKDNDVQAEASARFLVASDDIELLRPAAEHEGLSRIAADSEGRFHLADEQELVQYLDELQTQVSREARHKTVHWPDWKRLPASESIRDQVPGIWNSFALVSLLLFVSLVGAEWGLRRWWGLV